MAVTISLSELLQALRLGDSPEELAEVTRLRRYAAGAVERFAPRAPDSAHTEAAVRLIGYIYDQPFASRGDAYSIALRSSGAAAMLAPYRHHRAGSTTPDPIIVEEEPTFPTTMAVGIYGNQQTPNTEAPVEANLEWTTTEAFTSANAFRVFLTPTRGNVLWERYCGWLPEGAQELYFTNGRQGSFGPLLGTTADLELDGEPGTVHWGNALIALAPSAIFFQLRGPWPVQGD